MLRKYLFVFFVLLTAYCLLPTAAFPWGFFAHKKINHLAVMTLPPEMVSFYKKHIDYLSHHAVDADRRRHAVPDEACRHYIDMDHYGHSPFDSVPRHWKKAVEKYSEDTLKIYGIVPWHIEVMFSRLTQAFREGNAERILYLSADLGHYVSDAHVPLHTTENYNGQMTNQKGIHGFWESRLPELFFDQWNFFVGRAHYIEDVNTIVWQIIKESYQAKDSVLQFEAELNKKWSPDKKYSYEKNKKVYSAEYSTAYNTLLNGMVERRMRQSVLMVGCLWYTAWVNAGKPELNRFLDKRVADLSQTITPSGNLPAPKGHEE